MRMKICVPVMENSVNRVVRSLRLLERHDPDFIEIRFDSMKSPAGFSEIRSATERPLIATIRSKGQGGLFRGTEATSLEALTQAARDGFDYVDVELNTKDAHTKVHQLKQHGAKVIVSYHNTKLTPTDQALESILENEARAGADVCKIVSTARTYADNLRIKESNRIEAMTEGLKEMNIQTMESEDTFTIHGGRRAKRSSIHTTITG